MQEVNVSTITDLKELKAMAYDQIAQKEQAEANLKNINQRILQVSQGEKAIAAATDAAATPPETETPADS